MVCTKTGSKVVIKYLWCAKLPVNCYFFLTSNMYHRFFLFSTVYRINLLIFNFGYLESPYKEQNLYG